MAKQFNMDDVRPSPKKSGGFAWIFWCVVIGCAYGYLFGGAI